MLHAFALLATTFDVAPALARIDADVVVLVVQNEEPCIAVPELTIPIVRLPLIRTLPVVRPNVEQRPSAPRITTFVSRFRWRAPRGALDC